MPRARRKAPRDAFTAEERVLFDGLKTPALIQAFIDEVPYSTDPIYRSPRSVLRDRRAHCLDGALFAAAALERIGHLPVILDMRAVRDDDHVVAVFERHGRLGAVAKSNMVGLRYREPIHRSARELVISYFNDYYSVTREKTLRSYSGLFDLRRHEDLRWRTEDEGIEELVARLDRTRHYPVLTRAMIAGLSAVDERSYTAGMLGSNPAGLYQPGGEKG